MMGKRFKNKDLASKLGVSSTLVSLVLNNKADQHGIRKDTQEKVLALARQMGYFNSNEEKDVSLPVEETPGIIGMLVPSQNDPFVIQIAPYLQKAFSSIGMGFSVISKDPDDQRFDRMVGAFKKFFSGLILVGDAADDNTVRTLRATDYPFVALEKPQKTGRFNSVCTDAAIGARLIADHIQKLNYKNIVIVADHKIKRNERFLAGEIEYALDQIPSINKPVIVELDRLASDNEIDFGIFETFLRPPFRADIIISLHSYLVYPVMDLFRKRKLRVPQDIALISLEDGSGFDLMFSPVTCLRKPIAGMATKVANMIWSEIKNSGKAKYKRQVNIAPELIIRNSCGTL
jgi:LacI family transcriptional regulator